jgi:hypothetical protein
MVLGRGFAHIRLGPAFIGEIAIGFILLALMGSKGAQQMVLRFARERAGRVACLLLMLFCVYFVRGHLAYGAESYRDAVLLLYVLFAFFGYTMATGDILLDKCLKLLSVAFTLCFLYGLTYPFGAQVREISPIVNAEAEAYLFGHYTMNYVFVIGGIFYFMLLAPPTPLSKALVVVGITTLLVLFSRAGYVAFLLLLMVLAALTPRLKRRVRAAGYVALVLAVIGVLSMTDIYIPAQNRFRLSLPNVAQRLVSIFSGDCLVSPELTDFEKVAQGTKSDRISWAVESARILAEDKPALLLGKGFGFNLGEAIGFSPVIRYVHNSYVTALVLTGSLGLAVLLSFHALVIGRALVFVRRAGPADERTKRLVTFFLLYDLAFLIVACFGPLLECPFLAANLYFVSGICIALTGRARTRTISPFIGR